MSAVLTYLAIAVFGVGGWLVSLLIGPNSTGVLVSAAVLAAVLVSSVAALVTQGDIWSLFDPCRRLARRGGPEADYDEDR